MTDVFEMLQGRIRQLEQERTVGSAIHLSLSPERMEAIIRAALLADVAPCRLIHSILEVWADDWLNREDVARGDEPTRRTFGLIPR